MRSKSSRTKALKGGRRVMAAGLLLVIAAACGGRSDAQIAQDFINKGLKAHADKKLAEASKDYRQALVYDTNNKFALFNLGVIDQAAGRLRSAQFEYQLALQSDPRFAPALFNLAIVLTGFDRQEAADVYKRLIEVQPGNAAAHLNLGFLLRQLDQASEAQRELDKAVSLNPRLKSRVGNAPPQPTPTETP